MRCGRISCTITGTPRWTSCHAASQPARPPPIICTGLGWCSLIRSRHKAKCRRLQHPNKRKGPRRGLFKMPVNRREGGTGSDGISVFAGDIFNVGPVDAQITEIAVGQYGQLTNRIAIHGPAADAFNKSVNDNHVPYSIKSEPELGSTKLVALHIARCCSAKKVQRSNSAMQNLHVMTQNIHISIKFAWQGQKLRLN